MFLFSGFGENQNLSIRKILSPLARKAMYNRFVYKIYEHMLWNQIKNKEMPEHIGIILDGNRRWAYDHSLFPWDGHLFGAEKVEELLKWCLELRIKAITLYVFSTENFQRPAGEINEIFSITKDKLKKLLSDRSIHEKKVHIKAIGRINLLPSDLKEVILEAEKTTKEYDEHYLNIAIAYGGRAEIVDATIRIAEEVKDGKITPDQIDEKTIESHLYTSHMPKFDPDLIIRTSGEERLSGFLLWQGAYSELSFLDVYWPDFRKIDLWRAIRTYQGRSRRYGK